MLENFARDDAFEAVSDVSTHADHGPHVEVAVDARRRIERLRELRELRARLDDPTFEDLD